MLRSYLKQLKENAVDFKSYIDMVWCTLRYGASPNNYKCFGFENLNSKERATYVTNGLSRKMIRKFNDKNYIDIFENKSVFADVFSEFFKREWISTKDLDFDSFLKFTEHKDRFLYKPISTDQGQGIIVYDDLSDPKNVFEKVTKSNKTAILEEWIPQHRVLAAVYGDAVNCLRIITVFKDGETKFLAGGVTWGNGKQIANASASGIVSPVDFATGVLHKPAADFYGHVYDRHPITGANLIDIQLPFWHETLEMLKTASAKIPQVAYIGWDIAITPDGPALIEGNTTPGYRYYQIPAHMIDKKGNRAQYEECLK